MMMTAFALFLISFIFDIFFCIKTYISSQQNAIYVLNRRKWQTRPLPVANCRNHQTKQIHVISFLLLLLSHPLLNIFEISKGVCFCVLFNNVFFCLSDSCNILSQFSIVMIYSFVSLLHISFGLIPFYLLLSLSLSFIYSTVSYKSLSFHTFVLITICNG